MATWENANSQYTRKPYQFNTSFPSQGLGIVSLVPLSEWGSINLHNAGLDEGLGSDQLIVTGIVDDINDTCLSCNSLWSPGKVARVKTEGSIFLVASHCPHSMNSSGSQLTKIIERIIWMINQCENVMYVDFFGIPNYSGNVQEVATLVLAAGRPNSNFLFLRIWVIRPPVFLLLCHLSRDIPIKQKKSVNYDCI